MHFRVATYLIISLAARGMVNAVIVPISNSRKRFPSRRTTDSAPTAPSAPTHATTQETSVSIKKENEDPEILWSRAAEHLVNAMLKEHSHGIPRMSADSPRFIGNPELLSSRIMSAVKFLEDDFSDGVAFSLEEFATLILLSAGWEVMEDKALSMDNQGAWQRGESEKRKGHEKQLYRPLGNLFNVLKNSDEGKVRLGRDIDENIFHVQDPRPVFGSRIERKPDLGDIYIHLLELTEDQKLSDYLEKKKKIGVFWGIVAGYYQDHLGGPKHQQMHHPGRHQRIAAWIKTYFESNGKSFMSTTLRGGPPQSQLIKRPKRHLPPFHIPNKESKTLLMAMVCQLNKLSKEKPGFIPNLDLNEFDRLRNPEQLTFNFQDDPSTLVGATYTFTGSDGRGRRVRIMQVLYRAEGIIGRCSIVVEVVCLCEEADCVWHEEGNQKTKVMKISFPSKTRPCEDGLIGEARSKAESSGQRWALNHLPEVIDSITFPYHEHTTVQGRLKKHLKDDYEERVMRVTFSEKLHPLSELTDPREYAQVFYDILQIHQWLYECVGILHRDLSSGNIMYRRIDGKVYGVLNDFDLSSRVRDMDKGPTSNQRTGTRPFMSVDLLSPVWEGGHLYRHDLESLFYIMLCLACRYNAPGVPAAEPRSFSLWFSGTDREIFNDKTTFLLDHFQSLPIQSYFAGFQRWLRKIYDQLRGGYIQRPFSATNLSTSNEESEESEDEDLEFLQNDNDLNFDWNTLNRRLLC
ncbi:hypothetical protein F5876DRAFT_79747 [Lentinula aff. lateritia]|uniref:Uncharacterized protein n=1 Tax=Lentinula aff. lateritia TaxID=2804960 RepID=A0ACC1TS40_9AGAR|nr:hypothetical protein F5876DRAFT_79747 [Lentinula aff. lateritia]